MMKRENLLSERPLSYPASVIAGKMRLTAEDIAVLRNHVFVNGITSSQDAFILFSIHDSQVEKSREWSRYFINALATFIVRFCYPQGSMDELNTEWLIAMISRRGVVNSRTELDLLFHVIDIARHVPDRLCHFALEQICIALAHGDDAWASESDRKMRLQKADVQLASRVMSAIARSGGRELTEKELKSLSRIGVLSRKRSENTAFAS